jgi:hypothetical protein
VWTAGVHARWRGAGQAPARPAPRPWRVRLGTGCRRGSYRCIDQLAIALLTDSATNNIALDYYKKFAEYLRKEFEGNELRLPTSDISTDTWSQDIDVADATPSPEGVNIITVDFNEMTFAVDRALCEQHDISIDHSVDDRREELETARAEFPSGSDNSEETVSKIGDFGFPATT